MINNVGTNIHSYIDNLLWFFLLDGFFRDLWLDSHHEVPQLQFFLMNTSLLQVQATSHRLILLFTTL